MHSVLADTCLARTIFDALPVDDKFAFARASLDLARAFGQDCADIADSCTTAKAAAKIGSDKLFRARFEQRTCRAALLTAAKFGRVESVCFALDHNDRDMGITLEHAARSGNIDCVKLVYSRGLGTVNDILVGACRGGHVGLAKFALANGATKVGRGLVAACHGGHVDAFDFMYNEFGRANSGHVVGTVKLRDGLVRACRGGHFEIARKIVELGQKCNGSVMYVAVMGGNLDIVRLVFGRRRFGLGSARPGHALAPHDIWSNILISFVYAADIEDLIEQSRLDAPGNPHRMLHEACRCGDLDLAAAALSLDRNVSTKVIREAHVRGRSQILKLIFDNMDADIVEDVAAWLGREMPDEVIDMFIAAQRARGEGDSCLEWCLRGACEAGRGELIEHLIALGVTDFRVALGRLCHGMHLDLAEKMIRRANTIDWIDVHHVINMGSRRLIRIAAAVAGEFSWNNCLTIAVLSDSIDIAAFAVDQGATNLNRALALACSGGNFAIARLLISRGACNFAAAFEAASNSGHRNTMQMLIDAGYNGEPPARPELIESARE